MNISYCGTFGKIAITANKVVAKMMAQIIRTSSKMIISRWLIITLWYLLTKSHILQVIVPIGLKSTWRTHRPFTSRLDQNMVCRYSDVCKSSVIGRPTWQHYYYFLKKIYKLLTKLTRTFVCPHLMGVLNVSIPVECLATASQ